MRCEPAFERRERRYVFDIPMTNARISPKVACCMRRKPNHSRRALRQDNFHLSLIHNDLRNHSHDGDPHDVLPALRIVPRIVPESRVPPKRETVVPLAKERVTRAHLEDAELRAERALAHRGRRPEVRRRDVADRVVVVDVPDPRGEMDRQTREHLRRRAAVECL